MKILNKIGLLAVAIMSLTGCEKKVVDLQPIDQIPSERAISNMPAMLQAVNGVYSTWSARRPIYISALISDEVRLGTGTEYRNVGNILFNWNHNSDSQDWRDDETGGVWTNMYTVIDRANRVLELSANIPTSSTTEANLKSRYRGEMLALRAMAHYELLRNYGETPDYQADRRGIVVSTSYVKAPGAFRPARSKQSDAVAQINQDLTDARNLIPATFDSVSRITRNAVIATQARVALFTRNWQTVVDRATEVIASQPLSTGAAYTAIWTTRALPENRNSEVIWKLNVAASTATSSLGGPVGTLFQDVGAGAAVQASASTKLVSTFDQVNDIRWGAFFVPQATRTLIKKHGFNTGTNSENFVYDIKVLRTSELVLARAEAYAELNMLTEANNDLAMLRTARITGYVHVPITDKAALINEILLERYKELCFEGHRYYDLRRRRLPIQRDLADVGGNTAIQTLDPSNSKYLLPIPISEVFANPNIGQNPGY